MDDFTEGYLARLDDRISLLTDRLNNLEANLNEAMADREWRKVSQLASNMGVYTDQLRAAEGELERELEQIHDELKNAH